MQLHYPLNPTTGAEDATQLPWTNGVPSTGVEGSYPPFTAVVEPMTELANLIAQAGFTGTSSDLFQVMRSVRSGQLDFDATDTGTANAVICQIGVPHAQILAGLPFAFIKGGAANTTTTPTLTITDLSGNNGLTATIVKASGAAVAPGDLPANALIMVRAISATKFALVSLLALSDVKLTAAPPGAANPPYVKSAAGTYTFTATVTGWHEFTGWGAGGGGGGTTSTTSAGGGGGGGGRGVFFLYLNAGQTVTIVVGAGGTGGTSVAAPTAGGTTSVNGTAVASGGSPGANSSGSGAGTGGAPGNGLMASATNTPGQSGAQGNNVTGALGGPGGAAPGAGFGAYQTTNAGNPGIGIGSGGSGAVNAPGGLGSDGGIQVRF